VFAVNAQGQITSVTDTNIAINGSAVSGNISGSAGSVANALTLGTYLTGTSFNGSAAVTATVDATSANTASKVVARDSSGNFSAGTITAALTGNASTATAATNISGGVANQIPYQTAAATTSFVAAPTVTGSVLSWNGSAFAYATNIATATSATSATTATTATNLAGGSAGTIPYQSAAGTTVQLAAGTSGYLLQSNGASAPSWVVAPVANNGTLTLAVSGTGLSGSATFTANQAGSSTFTVTSNATSANTASAIVARDASGNFTAGTITAALTGNASGSAATFTSTSQNSQFNSIGVGTAGSGTAGEIRATNNVTAYYSDDRLKTRLGVIENALAKVKTLDTFYYEANDTAQALGYKPVREVGISAQQVQAIMPETVAPAPIDDQYLTVRYERLVPLLLAAIKELEAKVALLEAKG